MSRSFTWMAVAVALAYVPQAQAQGGSEADKVMMKASGEADALALVCGKWSETQIKAHKAKTLRLYVAHGVSPALFETTYAQGFNEVKALAKAQHVQPGSQACQRLPQATGH